MHDYVKVSTDEQTSELLKQVSNSIESAIELAIESSIQSSIESSIELSVNESIDKVGIKKKLEVVIQNQEEIPNFVKFLNEQLLKFDADNKKLLEKNLALLVSENVKNKKSILEELNKLLNKIHLQDEVLSSIKLSQIEIVDRIKLITKLEESIVTNYNKLSKKLNEIEIIVDGSAKRVNDVMEEVTNLKDFVRINNTEITKCISLIISNQNSIMEKINNIEASQNKPWYKKIFK